ncbi:MAG: TIGR04282 family arsenosugar biosynthesis glycosyltransferase [Saprospiraceae bacterium]|nr:TIGR04282 family arsenosugar biosynthesis glycosyltransferase [Lewinella sp.]
MSRQALLVFIRNPEIGKVKTRLAQDLGDLEALRIYNTLLAHTRQVTLAVDAHRLLFYSNFIDRNDEWPDRRFDKHLQPKGDLGNRMQQAFEMALKQFDAAVIVGSDCAELTPAILQTALDELEHHDCVIGPAIDGGYYLLGMRQLRPSLFQDMPWSTDQVYAETIKRMEAAGATYYTLPELSDIDYAEDWEQHRHLLVK